MKMLNFLVMTVPLLVTGCPRRECKDELVLSVGGCTKYWLCGVMTEYGYGEASVPVQGATLEVCRTIRK